MSRAFRRTLAVALWLLAPAAMLAQSGDADMGEVGFFGGGSFGLGTHPVIGGNSGMAFSRYGMGFIEASYMPAGKHTLRSQPDKESPQDSRLFDFNFSLHIRFPVRERWAPYGIVGAGLILNQYRAVITPKGALVSIDDFNFGFHTGAGFRYYIGENWGVRPEFRLIVSNHLYTRLSAGFFYTLPGNWP